jgi:hypothetical protein
MAAGDAEKVRRWVVCQSAQFVKEKKGPVIARNCAKSISRSDNARSAW